MAKDGWGAGARLIARACRQRRAGIALGVLVGLGWTLGKVSVGLLVQQAVDEGIEQDQMSDLRFWALMIVVAAFTVALFTGLRRYVAFREARWIEADLREQLFGHFQRLHFGYHDRTQTGQLMSRANTDLQQIQAFIVMIPLTISNGVTVLAVTAILVSIDPLLTLLALGSLPFLNVLATRFSRRLHPSVMGIQRESAELASVVEESVAGVRVVKGFGAEAVQSARLRVEADDVFRESMEAARIRAAYLPALELLPNIGLIATLAYGGHQVLDGDLRLGGLVAFNVYVAMLIWPLRMLGMIIAQGQRSAASAERVHEVLETDPDIAEPHGARPLPPAGPGGGRGLVRFADVRFAYGPDRPPVLDGFELTVPAGQSIALVGATGAGKTTVARLIPRFYDVDHGTVSVDGIDVRTLRLRELRKAVGIVFEDTFLFSDTIGANIAFADPHAPVEAVERAARLAGAHEFIRALPEGYATTIGERGYSLSGGQRQRLAIARAILADPRVLILDDATSSVDPTKEHEIRDALAEVMRGRTTLVIAHRPATIALADRVVLVVDGRVAADGTHQELLRTSAEYREVLAAAEREQAAAEADAGGLAAEGGDLMWGQGGVDPQDRLDAAAAGHLLRRALRMLGAYRRDVWVAGVMVVVWTATTLAGPFLVRHGIDQGIKRGDGGALDAAVVGYVVVAAISYVTYRAQVRLISRIGETFLRDVRIRVFDHLQKLSMPFYDREKAGVIVSRMTSDVDSLQELVQMGLLMFVSNGLLLVVSVLVLALVSWKLLLLCLVCVPVVVLASIKFQRDSNVAYLEVRDGIGATLSHLQEGIAGVRVVQAFGREEVEIDRFADRNRSLFDAHMRSVKISAWYLPVVEGAGLLTTAIALGVGGWWVHEDALTIGSVTFFVLTLSNLFEPLQQLSQLFNLVQSAGAGLGKLFALLDTPVDVVERHGAIDLPERGDIDVTGLGFAYAAGSPVLSDVDLHIPSGARIALVGPTGAGKSTLAKLIARLYDPTEGTVRFGGTDLRDATARSLRQRVVVVPQEGFLFNGTILDNVRLARAGASDDDVVAALEAIGVRERFVALPEGLRTQVQERGSRLSAGEKQLVSLARAALADPAVLVLDEATSSLDPGTEVVVEHTVNRLMEGRTVIVIAHRLSTAERADLVGVVADGRLQELGTHQELMAQGGRYTALFGNWTGGLAPADGPEPGAG